MFPLKHLLVVDHFTWWDFLLTARNFISKAKVMEPQTEIHKDAIIRKSY